MLLIRDTFRYQTWYWGKGLFIYLHETAEAFLSVFIHFLINLVSYSCFHTYIHSLIYKSPFFIPISSHPSPTTYTVQSTGWLEPIPAVMQGTLWTVHQSITETNNFPQEHSQINLMSICLDCRTEQEYPNRAQVFTGSTCLNWDSNWWLSSSSHHLADILFIC